MTREFFGRLVKIFDRFRRELDKPRSVMAQNMIEAQFEVIMELLDVRHTDSPLWTVMPLGEQVERMYQLCKAEYDSYPSTDPSDAPAHYHRSIDLGDLSAK